MDPTSLPLRDIHLPPPVSGWPPGPLWWALVVLLALGLGWLLWRWRRLRFRRHVLKAHHDIALDFDRHGDASRLAHDLCALLRRVLIGYRPRGQVAAITGNAWYEALRELTPGTAALPAEVARDLHEAQLRPDAKLDPADAIALTRRWLQALPPGGGAYA